MPQFAIRAGNPPAEVLCNGATVTNLGPGTIFYADNQDVSPTINEGTLFAGGVAVLDGTQWFTTNTGRSSLSVVGGVFSTGGPGAPGPRGPAGFDGPPGHDGADGTGFHWRGAWAGSPTTYAVGDVVYNAADLNVVTPLPTYIATTTTPAAAPPSTGWDLMPIAGPPGARGAPGPQGATGTPGCSGSTVTNAVVGQADRFYRAMGGTLRNEAGQLFWTLENDANSRPQNLDGVVSDAQKISVDYSSLQGARLASLVATPDETLRLAGIEAAVDATPQGAELRLFQNRRMSDFIHWDGTAKAWVLDKGVRSPFTLSGLDYESSDFNALVQAEAGLVAHYRFSEASGTTITDSSGSGNDGTINGPSGATYQAATGLTGDTASKSFVNAAGGNTHYLTFALMSAMDQSAFSIEWFGKLGGSTVLYHDGTGSTSSGYWVAKSGNFIAVRYGSAAILVTTHLWSELDDGLFHHVVFTKSGANITLWLDGVQIAAAGNATTTATLTPWEFGRSGQSGSSATSYAVTMDELAVYNVALPTASIKAHSYATKPTGRLTVTHDEAGDTDVGAIELRSRAAVPAARPVVRDAAGAVTSTSFDVEFYTTGGAKILAANTDMRLSVGRTVNQRAINPQNFKAYKFLDPMDYSVAVLADSPKDYWPLTDVAGSGTVENLGQTLRTGTVQSGVTLGTTGLITSESDTAAQFDGAQGKIILPNPAISGHVFSLECWFKCTGAGTVGATAFSTIVGWDGPGTRRIMVDRVTTPGLIRAEAGYSILSSAGGVANDNAIHHLVYLWNLLAQSMWVDGVLVATMNTTVGPGIPNVLRVGTYTDPSTNYSFKGFIQHLALYDKALTDEQILQHYAAGKKVVIKRDATVGTSVSLLGLLETLTPPPEPPPVQPLPVKSALPAGDIGGGPAHDCDIASLRPSILSSSGWAKKPLPTDVAGRNAVLLNGYTYGVTSFPAATSANWVRSLCIQAGFDPDTPQSELVPRALPGAQIGQAWMDVGEYIYRVPSTQPRRPFTHLAGSPGAPVFNDVINRLGGIPLPADARPHGSADRYIGLFEESNNRLWTIYGAMASQPATTKVEFTGSPTAGSFTFKFVYCDSATSNAEATFTPQAFVHYNATAADFLAALQSAKSSVNGTAFGATRGGGYGPSVVVTGGPLNVAPLICTFPLGEPLWPVGMQLTDSSLNAGTVRFTYTNSGPLDQGYGAAVITASPDGHVQGLNAFNGGPYLDEFDNSGVQWRSRFWPATATGIDMDAMVVAQDELVAAKAAGTNLGHCLVMSVGKAQAGPFPFVFPARSGDGANGTTDGSYIPEGARIAFPPDVDLSAVHPDMMPIAKTIRDYGIIPIDKTGFGIDCGKLQRKGFPGYTLPPGRDSKDYFGLYLTSGNASYLYNRSLPWHKAQIIDPSFSGP